ncbi:uncharacterized protein [Amphiura filiformis]|uniref:uncharacterized protein n=1 Tax=Amphiura filiformis TaxID=82378 RepID=UPI003B2141A5
MELFRGQRKPEYRMVMLPFLAPKSLSKATRKVVLRIYSAKQDAEQEVIRSEAGFNSVMAAPKVPFLLDPTEGDLIYHVKLDMYSSSKWNQQKADEVVPAKKFKKMQYYTFGFGFEKNVEVDSIDGCLTGSQGDDPACVPNTHFSYNMYGNTSQDENSDEASAANPDVNEDMPSRSSMSDSDILPSFDERTKLLVKARTVNVAQQREVNRTVLNSATELLCQDLEPERLQHELQSKGILSARDIENISSHGPSDKKVETLLNILKLKPSGYDCFMEALRGIDARLHDSVRQIEMEFINARNMHEQEIGSQQRHLYHVLLALPPSKQRDKVRDIFSSATELLCDNLQLTEVIRKLQANRELDDSDVEIINSIPDRAGRVEKLLSILKMKPVSAYLTFMEALGNVDKELYYDVIMKIMQDGIFPNEASGATPSTRLSHDPHHGHELLALPPPSSPARLDQQQLEINNNLEGTCTFPSSRSILEHLTKFLVRSGPLEEQDDRLRNNCEENGLKYRGITPGNGDCFFEAVADQLERIDNEYRPIASHLREDVSNYMVKHRVLQELDGDVDLGAYVKDCDWELFCKNMSKRGEWANHVVAVCTAHMLQIPIFIIMSSPSSSSDNNIFPIKGGRNAAHRKRNDSILLGHRWENHYQSLEPISER